MKGFCLRENFLFQRKSFEVRPSRNQDRQQAAASPIVILSDIVLDNIESYMFRRNMIDRDSRVRGLNIDYRPTSKYCHRAIITILF